MDISPSTRWSIRLVREGLPSRFLGNSRRSYPLTHNQLYISLILTDFNYSPLLLDILRKNHILNRAYNHALSVQLNDDGFSYEEPLHRNEEGTVYEKITESL